jgi:hypothetical protein
MYANDTLKFLYSSKWTFQYEWQWDDASDGLNMPTQAAFPADLTNQGGYFEPTVEILSTQIKGWNFTLVKTRLTSSTTYK